MSFVSCKHVGALWGKKKNECVLYSATGSICAHVEDGLKKKNWNKHKNLIEMTADASCCWMRALSLVSRR